MVLRLFLVNNVLHFLSDRKEYIKCKIQERTTSKTEYIHKAKFVHLTICLYNNKQTIIRKVLLILFS